MSNEQDIPVYASSGNIFADLGRPDAEEALARVRLAQQVAEIIDKRGISQSEAAGLMGLDQPKVSALVRGRLAGFSTDRLFRCLMALGQDVEIIIKDKPHDQRTAHIHVVMSTAAQEQQLSLR